MSGRIGQFRFLHRGTLLSAARRAMLARKGAQPCVPRSILTCPSAGYSSLKNQLPSRLVGLEHGQGEREGCDSGLERRTERWRLLVRSSWPSPREAFCERVEVHSRNGARQMVRAHSIAAERNGAKGPSVARTMVVTDRKNDAWLHAGPDQAEQAWAGWAGVRNIQGRSEHLP